MHRALATTRYLALVSALVLAPIHLAAGRTDHEHPYGGASEADGWPQTQSKRRPSKPAKSGGMELKDLELVDQHGRVVRFVDDVIGDDIVVIDFIYTNCDTVCPVLSNVLGQVQDKLGDRLGNEVTLVSLTVDPVRDTPQRLKAYAAKHKARDGWVWLTGAKESVDQVLEGLGAYAPNFEDHPTMVLVGDRRSGIWSLFFGFPTADRIVERVDAVAAVRARRTARAN